MIDIESLGLIRGAVVASIGAVRFNPYAGVQSAEEFLRESPAGCDAIQLNIDITDAINLGMTVGGETLKWWFTQGAEAQALAFLQNSRTVAETCMLLSAFILRGAKPPEIWCNGANFDNILLEAMYNKVDLAVPWKFYNVRCLRTIKQALNYDIDLVPPNPIKHSALHDAIHQVQTLQAVVASNPNLLTL